MKTLLDKVSWRTLFIILGILVVARVLLEIT
jgi:hypothetical protein